MGSRVASVVLALALALSVAGVAAGAVGPNRNPTGRWATPNTIQSVLLSRALGIGLCGDGVCTSSDGKLVQGPTAERVTRVLSATVTGVAPSKLVDGVRRYRLFDVSACTIHYYRGAHRYRVHFRWFTRRPPGGAMTTIGRDGTVSVGRDDGEPYARDSTHPRFDPLALATC